MASLRAIGRGKITSGQPIGREDLFIAAHALSANVPLVTNNEREFLRVPNLQVENWVD